MTVRTRFAPSPTGSLHIGNVRSGLFAYLYARHNHGTFILRIDDTDLERSTKESLEEHLADLKWLGMEWDEGPPDETYFQTNRVARHREAALKLLRERKAYPCYCSAEELDAKRKQAEREHRRPVYDRKCRGLDFPADLALPDKSAGRNYTIRFAMPLDGETVVDDLVKGRIVFQNSELDDFIIVRSDGSPIYNFASILDDVDMHVTHIVRGDDHVSNTPRQMQMAYALGFTPPAFAHLPQVLGPDGSKLSKRHGATSVVAYREAGYFPEAMLNYLARLGWSHGDQEIFSKDELIKFFGFEACGKSAGVFNAEKLLWLNFHYLKERPLPQLVAEVKPFIAQARMDDSGRRRVAREGRRDAARARQDAGRAGGLRVVLSEGRHRDRSEGGGEIPEAGNRGTVARVGRRTRAHRGRVSTRRRCKRCSSRCWRDSTSSSDSSRSRSASRSPAAPSVRGFTR